MIDSIVSVMLRQSKNNNNATSQNENPNIINKENVEEDTENNNENVKKNNFLQTSSAQGTALSNSANQSKRQNQTAETSGVDNTTNSVLKSVKCDRSKILNVSDSETEESSVDPHMHHNMNSISKISTFSD